MRLRRCLLLAAAACAPALAAAANSSVLATVSTPTVAGWYECTAVTFASQLPDDASDAASLKDAAQCAIFKAPLCYTGVCEDATGAQVDIFVKRIKAITRNAPNIFFMQGGPGAASPVMEAAMTGVYTLMNGAVNVYTMDHRGTGRSTKLDCVAAQAQTSASPGGTSIDSSEVGTCADEIEAKYGSDLSAFSVTSAASDLNYFITNFLDGQKTYVYGVSYGSSVVERLIHLNTTGIVGYILDGISTTSGSNVKNFEYFSTWDQDFDEVGAYFLSFCGKNSADCGKYFKDTSVSEALRTLTLALDAGTAKCTAPIDKMFAKLFEYTPGDYFPGTILRQVMGSLLGDSDTRNFIPVLTYRITRCNSDDLNVLNHFVNALGDTLTSPSESAQYTSDLLYKLIVYSEFWETPTPTYSAMTARFLNTTISSGSASAVETYCAFTKEKSAACQQFADYMQYEASPLVYKKDKYWNVAAKPAADASVLLMSSKMDPQTPHKYATYLLDALDTDNKELVTFEASTHGTLFSTRYMEGGTPCGMKILVSYLAAGGDLSRLDKSCVSLMPAVSFALDETLVRDYLNASSAFDGAFVGSETADFSNDNSGGNGKSSSGKSSDSGGGSSYKTVFIVFVVLFVVAAAAAVVFLLKWRKSRKNEATTDVQGYAAA